MISRMYSLNRAVADTDIEVIIDISSVISQSKLQQITSDKKELGKQSPRHKYQDAQTMATISLQAAKRGGCLTIRKLSGVRE